MITEELRKSFEEDKQVTRSLLRISVKLNVSQVLEEYSKCLLSEIQRLSPVRGLQEIEDLEFEDILKYLTTLVYYRVLKVNNERLDPEVKSIYRLVAVPVLMSQITASIGKARDEQYNLEFVPTANFEASDILAAADMLAISDIMTRLEANGLKIVYGLTNDPTGDLGFMAMQHVENQVISYRRDHPVYAFLASFFVQEKLNEVTGAMARIVYGDSRDYSYRVRALV